MTGSFSFSKLKLTTVQWIFGVDTVDAVDTDGLALNPFVPRCLWGNTAVVKMIIIFIKDLKKWCSNVSEITFMLHHFQRQCKLDTTLWKICTCSCSMLEYPPPEENTSANVLDCKLVFTPNSARSEYSCSRSIVMVCIWCLYWPKK